METAQVERDLWSVAELSARKGIPIETLRYWRRIGRGPKSFAVGRRVVYRVAYVQAWEDAAYQSGTAS